MRPTPPAVLTAALVLAMAASAGAQHQGHEHPAPSPPQQAPAPTDTPKDTPKEPIPPVTDADRAAAFPPAMAGHAVHDRGLRFRVLFDQLEWEGGDDGGPGWDNTTWIGGDLDRLWLRSEGESHGGRVESAFLDVLWGRRIARWWDVVGGIRQDVRPGPAQTWVGGGVQGLAPYRFEVEATGYVGAHGRTLIRLEGGYDLLVTNRLILQPTVEAELHGMSDPERRVGRGLSTLEGGVRLRYEIRREFAPFVGVTWTRSFFGTADLARTAGEEASSTRLAVGVRTWF
jgi:copper resistance protein B